MTAPRTLLQLAGADPTPARVADASLVLIDMQNEYRSGPIAVTGADAAIASAARLLDAARAGRAPVIHVAHAGRPGGLFDRTAARGQIVEALAPAEGEAVIEKTLPNAFAGTSLADQLTLAGRSNVIIIGFMTHMCVSTTARAALDHGYRVTIDASSCATRDLPDRKGGVIPAGTLHDVALAELTDRFAVVVSSPDALL